MLQLRAIRRVRPTSRTLRALAGGVLAVALVTVPTDVAQAAPGGISTIAGTTFGFAGDGGAATAASINYAYGIAATADGGFLLADTLNNRVRRIDPAGVITTVAGNGSSSYSGDGGLATAAAIDQPFSVSPTADGGYLVADRVNARIRKVSAAGIITTVAGLGGSGFSGDGGLATAARLYWPYSVAATPDGGFLIVDGGSNNRIRKVDAAGIITTVAGTGELGNSGDGGPAAAATLNDPRGVTPTPDGGFMIADTGNSRVRKVSASGTITAIAGTGVPSYGGDDGPATSAWLKTPWSVSLTPDGGYLIADFGNARVRKVDAAGTITTVAGTGVIGSDGDGGPATAARLANPTAVASLPDGAFVFVDLSNWRVRRVEAPTPVDTTAPDTAITEGPADGSVSNSNETSVQYSGIPTADTDHFECRLDAGAFTACPNTGTGYNGLSDGPHTVRVRAVDAAGNADATPAIRTWTVDTVAPVITMTSPINAATYKLSLVVGPLTVLPKTLAAYACTDTGGSGITSCVGTVANGAALNTASLGVKSFTVTATDNAGNTSTKTVTYRVVLLGCVLPTVCI